MPATASVVTQGSAAGSIARAKADKRRAKLRQNLVATITARYHIGRPGLPELTPEQVAEVEQEIDDLLTHGSVTDGDMKRMVRSLRRAALGQRTPARSESAPVPESSTPPQLPAHDALPPIGDQSSTGHAVLTAEALASQGGGATSAGARTPMCASQTETSLVNPDSKLAKSAKPSVIRRRENLVCDEPWNRLIQEDMQKYHEEQKEHQRKVLGKIRDCRGALDKQVSEIKRIRDQEQEEARRYAEEENNRRRKWLEDERRRQAEKQAQQLREKQVRDQLLEAERQQRLADIQREKEEEEEYRRQLQREARQEAEAEMRKKQANMAEYRQFMEFNKAEQGRKREIQEHEKQQDKAMLAAHAALLERQEQQRKAELKRCQEKQAAKVDTFLKIYHQEQQKQVEDERRRERDMRHIADKQRREEEQRLERQRAGKQQFQQTLDEQLKAKQYEKQREIEEQAQFRELQEHEVRASLAYDAECRARRRQVAKKHLNELNSQVAEKHEKNKRDIQVQIARQIDVDTLLPRSVRRNLSPSAASRAPAAAAEGSP
eukprot:TRINITY_DN332_c0_g1_i1.p1 TRINITY_DN332_c0_g1~~TRINITY_DN332_c0_g1_i1.p1  ORF type:complete len:580 (+),score=264.52 TRINITY_DN332_c0_g1_i1:99-1742(+)